MLLAYQLRYGWRHFRKTETSHALGRAINGAEWGKKLTKHYARHAVYNTLVTGRPRNWAGVACSFDTSRA